MTQPIRIATRGSALALAQAGWVADRIASASGLETALVRVNTLGDDSTASLKELGGTGAFAIAVRDAVLDGRCDVAVHSLKDLPTAPCDGLTIAAIPTREDPRDALCARDGLTLETLPSGARVGTGAPRRQAQLLALRPDLEVVDLRGNVDTRLGRVGKDLDAVIVALAGLRRLARDAEATELLDLERWPTAPGQGALAIEIREGDAGSALGRAVASLDDPASRATATVERAVLAALEAGCSAPLGVAATLGAGGLRLTAIVYSLDGRRSITATAGPEGERVEGRTAQVSGDGAKARSAGRVPEAVVTGMVADVVAALLAGGAAELGVGARGGGW